MINDQTIFLNVLIHKVFRIIRNDKLNLYLNNSNLSIYSKDELSDMTTATNTHYHARADYGPVLDKTTVSTTTSFLNWAASNKEWSSDYKNLVAASTKVTFQHLIAFLFVVTGI